MFGRKQSSDKESAPSTSSSDVETGNSDPRTAEEAHWVEQAKQGDRQAFARIVEAYQRPIFNLCYRMLGDGAEAEDAAQEAFIRAFLKLGSYDSSRKFSSWLFSIASHYCIDRLRKRRIQWLSLDELPPWRSNLGDEKPQPEESMIELETSNEIRDLLEALPSDYRAAVIMKYWHNMAYEEIAASLDTTVSAIKSRLFRARKMMAATAVDNQRAQLAASGMMLAES